MTEPILTSSSFTAAAPADATVAACHHCGAPLDAAQRYCVDCGTHRLHADDPAVRYLASAARRSRVAATPPVAAARPFGTGGGLVPALLVALLPVAAGVGILVGRGGSGEEDAIIRALQAQKAPIVRITAGGAGTGAGAPAASATGRASKAAKTKARRAAAKTRDLGRTSDGAKILATGPAGSARRLEGAKVTAKQRAESKAAIEQINKAKGKAYVESQRNLPDQIVVP